MKIHSLNDNDDNDDGGGKNVEQRAGSCLCMCKTLAVVMCWKSEEKKEKKRKENGENVERVERSKW